MQSARKRSARRNEREMQKRLMLDVLDGQTATAVAFCKAGKGQIRVNGVPLNLVEPEIMRMKVYEPLLVCIRGAATTAGGNPFEAVDIKVRVNGGGHTSQVYAIRQALARAVVAYTGKYNDAATALELRKTLISYDRTLLVSDPRRCEPKKFGGVCDSQLWQKGDANIASVSTARCSCQIPEVLPLIYGSTCASWRVGYVAQLAVRF